MKYTLVSTNNENEKSKIGRKYEIAEKPSCGMLALCAMGSDSCTHYSIDLLLSNILYDYHIKGRRIIYNANYVYIFKEEPTLHYYKILLNGSSQLTEIAVREEITEKILEKEWLVTELKSMFRTGIILRVYQSTKEAYESALKFDEAKAKEVSQ